MDGTYLVLLEVWPHSTGEGKDNDQAKVGDRRRTFEVQATGIHDALRQADLIVKGIKTNPMVWAAPIRAINHKDR